MESAAGSAFLGLSLALRGSGIHQEREALKPFEDVVSASSHQPPGAQISSCVPGTPGPGRASCPGSELEPQKPPKQPQRTVPRVGEGVQGRARIQVPAFESGWRARGRKALGRKL